jgi:hypothetical protein
MNRRLRENEYFKGRWGEMSQKGTFLIRERRLMPSARAWLGDAQGTSIKASYEVHRTLPQLVF